MFVCFFFQSVIFFLVMALHAYSVRAVFDFMTPSTTRITKSPFTTELWRERVIHLLKLYIRLMGRLLNSLRECAGGGAAETAEQGVGGKSLTVINLDLDNGKADCKRGMFPSRRVVEI